MNADLVAGLMWLGFVALVLLYFFGTSLVVRWTNRRRGGEER